MKTIGLSEKAAATHPALASWLKGAGLACLVVAAEPASSREQSRILHVSERSVATHRDILTDFADGAPELIRAAHGLPTTIRFGFDDMAFGHALIAELGCDSG